MAEESFWFLSVSTSTTFLAFIIIFFLVGITRRKRREPHRLPPGSRGWPLIGDTFAWLNAVSGSHPSSFVEQQVKRFYLCLIKAMNPSSTKEKSKLAL